VSQPSISFTVALLNKSTVIVAPFCKSPATIVFIYGEDSENGTKTWIASIPLPIIVTLSFAEAVSSILVKVYGASFPVLLVHPSIS
jgi:hypothetical protein